MESFFLAVQHPGDGGDDWEGFGRPVLLRGSVDALAGLKDDTPVRPSVLGIAKQGGGKIAMS